ncbi:MAG: type IV pilus biogenesis/stability protein PilW [Acidithiobacillus ferrooxidans]|nr:type IV pilus biogenesis/stability protein PilW [Acidithiobacillus ferrooxidans]MDD5004082.1 type IV pilus biogenesis/stability protein PilW [Acidithiobacillus sp.]MDD5379590.1 type IV pilus biogenesis/stability protein PilW [Acidithiobacillus sp.]
MKRLLGLGAGVLLLSGCGLFGGKGAGLTPDQQMAAYIAHEHKANASASDFRPTPVNSDKAKAGIYTSLGAAYLQNGHPRQAIRELQLAIAANSRYANAYNVMGLAYEQLQQRDLARSAFRRALSIDAKNPEYLNNYGAFLINSRNYAEAIIELKRATSDPLYSTPQFAWTNLAQAYAGLKDLSAARDALNRALYLVPNYPPALLMLAELDYKDGKADAAFAHLQVVLAQEPDNADALLLAGRIAALQGRTTQAQSLWQRCVTASPYSAAGKQAQQLLLQNG